MQRFFNVEVSSDPNCGRIDFLNEIINRGIVYTCIFARYTARSKLVSSSPMKNSKMIIQWYNFWKPCEDEKKRPVLDLDKKGYLRYNSCYDEAKHNPLLLRNHVCCVHDHIGFVKEAEYNHRYPILQAIVFG